MIWYTTLVLQHNTVNVRSSCPLLDTSETTPVKIILIFAMGPNTYITTYKLYYSVRYLMKMTGLCYRIISRGEVIKLRLSYLITELLKPYNQSNHSQHKIIQV